MSRTIFYSWQSDIEPNKHRYFIERCLKNALTELEQNANIYMEYDRDTIGTNGSPDISKTIFDKIDKSVLFVCDVSIINKTYEGKKTPNPNVLIELGYAVSKLGWERVICFFDINTGNVEELPFDIRQKRVTVFDSKKGKTEEKRITDILKMNITTLYINGKLFNPLNDYMKGRIDKAILDIAKQASNLMYGTYSLSEGLTSIRDFLHLTYDEIIERMCICEFPAFVVLNTYDTAESNLRDILKELLTSPYFSKEWSYTVLELLDWLREYRYIISKRNENFPIYHHKEKEFLEIAVVSAQAINKNNPPNSHIVLKTYSKDGKSYIDSESGHVVNTTIYPSLPGELSKCCRIKPSAYEIVAKKVYKLTCICRQWLDITDSEFILEPDSYVIF